MEYHGWKAEITGYQDGSWSYHLYRPNAKDGPNLAGPEWVSPMSGDPWNSRFGETFEIRKRKIHYGWLNRRSRLELVSEDEAVTHVKAHIDWLIDREENDPRKIVKKL